ncbi:MAG: peptidoglycan-associated lipoprotein Pal [Betaproteobacteria bacterium]|nr:peptidoglycan-associated lipoprotein Pal [Betaproteobacteria bacterium]
MTTTHHRLPVWAALTAALALLAGCGTTKLPDEAATPVESRNPVATTPNVAGAPATSTGTPQSQVASVDLERAAAARAAAAAAASSQRIVYFDFDSFVIKSDYKAMLDAHAQALTANRAKRTIIEGHADERGGREYNLALGQKRAGAVLNSLKLLGASEGQMEAVSFGEERPAVTGSGEEAWAKNRRAELKDR